MSQFEARSVGAVTERLAGASCGEARFGTVWTGLVRQSGLGAVCIGSVWHGLARFGKVWQSGRVWDGQVAVWQVLVRTGLAVKE